jgi:hypothetical protein
MRGNCREGPRIVENLGWLGKRSKQRRRQHLQRRQSRYKSRVMTECRGKLSMRRHSDCFTRLSQSSNPQSGLLVHRKVGVVC